MRLGISFGYQDWGAGLPGAIALAQEADRLGYHSGWVAEAYGSTRIALVVKGVKDYATLAKFKTQLTSGVAIVKELNQRTFEGGQASFDVECEASADKLAAFDQKFPGSPLAEKALFLRGLIAAELDDKPHAIEYLKQALSRFPEGELRGPITEVLMELEGGPAA